MEQPSPIRLYATVLATALLAFGIVGFFFDASFDRPEDVGAALGLRSVNGWANCFHILTGALGLLVLGFAARRYALWTSALYLAVFVAGVV
jgi:uncharacterized membrane protein